MSGYRGVTPADGYKNPDGRALEVERRRQVARRNDSPRQAVRVAGGCWLRPEWVADLNDHEGDDA
jgi:hypothetical protein